MKKLFLLFLVSVCLFEVSAQNKTLAKALKKEYKAKMKEYKNEGWKITASSRSLDVALLLHYEKLSDENTRELVGTVSNCRSINVCRQAALNNAAAYYASLAGSHLKGRVVSDLGVNQSDNDATTEFDKLYAAYERCVEKEIKGEIQESYTISRTSDTGEKELQTYFTVNEDEATKARIRAWENAQRESEAAQKYATEVSKFINEGFSPDK